MVLKGIFYLCLLAVVSTQQRQHNEEFDSITKQLHLQTSPQSASFVPSIFSSSRVRSSRSVPTPPSIPSPPSVSSPLSVPSPPNAPLTPSYASFIEIKNPGPLHVVALVLPPASSVSIAQYGQYNEYLESIFRRTQVSQPLSPSQTSTLETISPPSIPISLSTPLPQNASSLLSFPPPPSILSPNFTYPSSDPIPFAFSPSLLSTQRVQSQKNETLSVSIPLMPTVSSPSMVLPTASINSPSPSSAPSLPDFSSSMNITTLPSFTSPPSVSSLPNTPSLPSFPSSPSNPALPSVPSPLSVSSPPSEPSQSNITVTQTPLNENKRPEPLGLLPEEKKQVADGGECKIGEVNGVCKHLRKCPSAIQDIIKGKLPKICSINNNTREAVVCCVASLSSTPELGTLEPIPDVFSLGNNKDLNTDVGSCDSLPPPLNSTKKGQKATQKCQEYQKLVYPCVKSAVADGVASKLSRANRCHHSLLNDTGEVADAALNEFPHMALLGFGSSVDNIEWLCGGSLISEKFILTAGMCNRNAYGPVTYVALGILKRSDVIDENNRYKVKKIHKHPDYMPPKLYNDISLLELEKEVPLSEFLVPACIPTEELIDDSHATFNGWSTNSIMGTSSTTLKKVALAKYDTEQCTKLVSPTRLIRNGFDPITQICYRNSSTSDKTCEDVRGNPLQVKNNKILCMYTIIGVTSFGPCGSREYGLYTRVAHYLDWIESTVWP